MNSTSINTNSNKKNTSFFNDYYSKLKFYWYKQQYKKFKIFDELPFFSKTMVKKLSFLEEHMKNYDEWLYKRLDEKRGEGIKTWEYGQLLCLIFSIQESKNWNVIDIGTGNSTFPAYVSQYLKKIITVDLNKRLEKQKLYTKKILNSKKIDHITGTMMKLPILNESLDLVVSISAIEHLDDLGLDALGNRVLEIREVFLDKTIQVIKEMVRILKHGGYLYLTTDVYCPELQKTCNWCLKKNEKKIKSAYYYEDIKNIFIKTIKDLDCLYNNRLEISSKFLIDSDEYSMYRGRYFTTFSLIACKR